MTGRPDAVKFPAEAVPPVVDASRPEAVVLFAEDLLDVDLEADEFARCGDQGGWYFCTRAALADLRGPGPMLFRADDQKTPRYAWTPAPGRVEGVEFGTLLDES